MNYDDVWLGRAHEGLAARAPQTAHFDQVLLARSHRQRKRAGAVGVTTLAAAAVSTVVVLMPHEGAFRSLGVGATPEPTTTMTADCASDSSTQGGAGSKPSMKPRVLTTGDLGAGWQADQHWDLVGDENGQRVHRPGTGTGVQAANLPPDASADWYSTFEFPLQGARSGWIHVNVNVVDAEPGTGAALLQQIYSYDVCHRTTDVLAAWQHGNDGGYTATTGMFVSHDSYGVARRRGDVIVLVGAVTWTGEEANPPTAEAPVLADVPGIEAWVDAATESALEKATGGKPEALPPIVR